MEMGALPWWLAMMEVKVRVIFYKYIIAIIQHRRSTALHGHIMIEVHKKIF